MDYKMKRAASAKLGKKFAAALSAAVLVAPSVASAVQPMVVLADAVTEATVGQGAYKFKVSDDSVVIYVRYVGEDAEGDELAVSETIQYDSVAGKFTSTFAVGPDQVDSLTDAQKAIIADADKFVEFYVEADELKGLSYDGGVIDAEAGEVEKTKQDLKDDKITATEFTVVMDDATNTKLSSLVSTEQLANVKVVDAEGWDLGTTTSEIELDKIATITATVPENETGKHFGGWGADDVYLPDSDTLTVADLEAACAKKANDLGLESATVALAPTFAYNEYTLTLDLQGGEIDGKTSFSLSADPDVEAKSSTDATAVERGLYDLQELGDTQPTKSGSEFIGYTYTYTDADDEEQTVSMEAVDVLYNQKWLPEDGFDAASKDGGTLTVTAVWSDAKAKAGVTVINDAQQVGDEWIPGKVVDARGNVLGEDGFLNYQMGEDDDLFDLTAEAADGYSFAGWERVADGKIVSTDATLTAAQQNEFLTVDNDNQPVSTTYTATWEGRTVNVHYDLNGATHVEGTDEITDREFTTGGYLTDVWTVTAVNKSYSKENYVFTGWNTAADGSGVMVDSTNADKVLASDDSDKTLYATWAPAEDVAYVNFSADGAGSVSEEQVVVTFTEVNNQLIADLPKVTVTAEAEQGNKLTGWSIKKADGTLVPVKELKSLKVKIDDQIVTISAPGDKDFTGAELTPTVLAGNLIWEFGRYNEQTQEFVPGVTPGQTYEVVATFEAFKYKAAFAGLDVREYTVGDTTTPWPEGTWLYDGSEVKQADLDKLVTEDGQVFSLVQKQEADKAALKDAVADAEKVDPSAYTDETAKPFTDALAAAQEVLKDEEAAQSQVDKAVADLAAAKAALVAKPADGWHQAGTDSWQYAKGGEYVKGAWVSDGGEWYYMDANGFMLDGWMQDSDGNWYFLSQNHDGTFGAMVTGWVLSDGLWYYMNPNAGGPKGAMMTGWQWVNGKCYYLYEQTGGPKGACAISTTINGWQVGPDGAWIQ